MGPIDPPFLQIIFHLKVLPPERSGISGCSLVHTELRKNPYGDRIVWHGSGCYILCKINAYTLLWALNTTSNISKREFWIESGQRWKSETDLYKSTKF